MSSNFSKESPLNLLLVELVYKRLILFFIKFKLLNFYKQNVEKKTFINKKSKIRFFFVFHFPPSETERTLDTQNWIAGKSERVRFDFEKGKIVNSKIIIILYIEVSPCEARKIEEDASIGERLHSFRPTLSEFTVTITISAAN